MQTVYQVNHAEALVTD